MASQIHESIFPIIAGKQVPQDEHVTTIEVEVKALQAEMVEIKIAN